MVYRTRNSVYVRFHRHRTGWRVHLMDTWGEYELKGFTFADDTKIEEMASRGNALKDLASRQALELGVRNGQGGFMMELNDEQFHRIVVRSRFGS